MITAKYPVYTSVVRISREYLGPTGERFIRRQIEVHLKVRPENIRAEELPELIAWSKLAFALLTENENHINSFTKDLEDLADEHIGRKRHGKAI